MKECHATTFDIDALKLSRKMNRFGCCNVAMSGMGPKLRNWAVNGDGQFDLKAPEHLTHPPHYFQATVQHK